MFVALSPVEMRATFTMQAVGKGDPTGGFAADGAFVKTFVAGDGDRANPGEPVHVRVTIRAAPGGLAIDVEQAAIDAATETRGAAATETRGASDAATETRGAISTETRRATGAAATTETRGAITVADAIGARWATHLPPADGHAEVAALLAGHRRLADLHHTNAGMRMLRVPWLWDIAASAILQQRVRFVDATRAWRRIVARHGSASPLGRAFPSARQLARLTVAHVEACGVDVKRARTLHAFAREQVLRDVVGLDRDLATLRARLPAHAGIGPWTTAMILAFGYGDPDAVLVGDVELPRRVCWTLARDAHGTDDKMLALLAPYAGHRARVARLVLAANDPPPRIYDGIR